MSEARKYSWGAKALGVEVKNDIEDAKVLSRALHLAKEGQVNIPVFNEDVEQIKELMAFISLLKNKQLNRRIILNY